MTLSGSFSSTLVTCLSATLVSVACRPDVSAIRASGRIAPEALPLPSEPPFGPWTSDCLAEGRKVHGDLRLTVVEEPAYDLSRFEFQKDGFLILQPEAAALKAGRVIGRIVVTDPNDRTLDAMDDHTKDWNRDPSNSGWELAWQRDAEGNVWRSVLMVFQVEREDPKGRSFRISPLNDQRRYEPLFPKLKNSERASRLFSYRDLESIASSLIPSEVDLLGWLLPNYAGVVSFETEALETYREDGTPAGCLPVDRL